RTGADRTRAARGAGGRQLRGCAQLLLSGPASWVIPVRPGPPPLGLPRAVLGPLAAPRPPAALPRGDAGDRPCLRAARPGQRRETGLAFVPAARGCCPRPPPLPGPAGAVPGALRLSGGVSSSGCRRASPLSAFGVSAGFLLPGVNLWLLLSRKLPLHITWRKCSRGIVASGFTGRMKQCAVVEGLLTSFVVDEVSSIIKEAIESAIGGNAYQHSKVNQWTTSVVEQTLSQLTKLGKPFKYIVTCVIMQKNGAGLHTASSCFWDNSSDGKEQNCWIFQLATLMQVPLRLGSILFFLRSAMVLE
uniref:Dynein light chain Tctex-type 1 n=2 Tax=Neoaves TaxID=3078114 RepID=A0A8B9RYA2_9AVES